MKITNSVRLFVFTAVVMASGQSALAQQPTTGTHIKSNKVPSYVMQINEPDEVEQIRRLLNAGEKDKALALAEKYLDDLRRATNVGIELLSLYYAYNAYCTVLTSLGRTDEAIEACTQAMAKAPLKWSAVNNRGTAKFVAGMWDEAMADYETAFAMAGAEEGAVRETIQHNMNLVRERRDR